MSFRDIIKAQIGAECYERIEAEAQRDVSQAMRMPLKNEYDDDQYYSLRLLLREFGADFERFEKAKLHVLPMEIAHVLFRCRLLRAAKDEREFQQRGGGRSFFENRAILPSWSDRATASQDALEDQFVSGLQTDIQERTLVCSINSLKGARAGGVPPQNFFEDLFASLAVPLVSFMDDDSLIEKHKQRVPGLRTYDIKSAKEFFSAPSLGYTVTGAGAYCFWYGLTWLRTFLNMLRIATFIHPGQREFSLEARMEPPTFPVFLGRHSLGTYQWREDEKESWEKLPDGCLFRSWGFRSLSNMWLDRRNYAAIKQFMLDHKIIFDHLKNPWSERNTTEVAPTLDILSSATQIPDLGAKILLIYCCLEHLFVPSEAGAENSKYIKGGLKALNAKMESWFGTLYALRCEYAHEGFVLRTEKTLALITASMKNVMTLLAAKLSVS